MDMQNYKRSYLDTEIAYRKEGITFIPLVSEADGGGWGPAGQAVWKEPAMQKSTVRRARFHYSRASPTNTGYNPTQGEWLSHIAPFVK